MKRPRTTTRERSRALKLRALADDAAAALEAWTGDTGPQAREADRRAWNQLVQLVHDRNAAAERAEQRERERPHEKQREKSARVAKRIKLARSGTWVTTTNDRGDVQRHARCCLCEVAILFSGEPDDLWWLGWRSAWVATGTPAARRRWYCAECWTSPTLTEEAPSYERDREAVTRGTSRGSPRQRKRWRHRFDRLLARLEETEPERAKTWKEAVGA